MRLSRHRRATLPELNMTPLIDIVFLLIIFFMTVSQVSRINSERLELPELAGSQDQEVATLTININAAGQPIIAGRQVDVRGVVAAVGQTLADRDLGPSQIKVVLRVDRNSRSEPVNDIVKQLEALGVYKIYQAVQVP